MLSDTATLSFALAYGSTLLVALLMFLGQLAAISIILVLAGAAQLMAYPVQAALRSLKRTNRP